MNDLYAAIAAATDHAHFARLTAHVCTLAEDRVLTAEEAELLLGQIQERQRRRPAGSSRPPRRGTIFRPRQRVSSPDRRASLERRRRIATSGELPAEIACRFTTGGCAVLVMIAREVETRGVCAVPIDRLAALAGVSRRLVQTAIREAEALGLLTVEERRRIGRPNLPNRITIVSAAWLTALRLSRRSTGCKFQHPTKKKVISDSSARRQWRTSGEDLTPYLVRCTASTREGHSG